MSRLVQEPAAGLPTEDWDEPSWAEATAAEGLDEGPPHPDEELDPPTPAQAPEPLLGTEPLPEDNRDLLDEFEDLHLNPEDHLDEALIEPLSAVQPSPAQPDRGPR